MWLPVSAAISTCPRPSSLEVSGFGSSVFAWFAGQWGLQVASRMMNPAAACAFTCCPASCSYPEKNCFLMSAQQMCQRDSGTAMLIVMSSSCQLLQKQQRGLSLQWRPGRCWLQRWCSTAHQLQIHRSLGGVDAQAGAWRLRHRWSGCRETLQHHGRTSARKCPASSCSSVGDVPIQTASSTMTCPTIQSQSLWCVLRQNMFKVIKSLLLQMLFSFKVSWPSCCVSQAIFQCHMSTVYALFICNALHWAHLLHACFLVMEPVNILAVISKQSDEAVNRKGSC